MTNHTPTTETPNKVMKHAGTEEETAENDLNDTIFILVTMFVYLLYQKVLLFQELHPPLHSCLLIDNPYPHAPL
jgi:hypothetical protein